MNEGSKESRKRKVDGSGMDELEFDIPFWNSLINSKDKMKKKADLIFYPFHSGNVNIGLNS